MPNIASLTSAGAREKIHDAAMNVKMPQAIKDLFEQIGNEKNTSASYEVRVAMQEYLHKRGY